MVAFSGALVALPAFGYSTALWAGRSANGAEALKTAAQVWIASYAAPTAVHFQSSLFGYLTVCSIFGALGFGVASRGLCIAVGFDSRDAMQRCCLSSLLLVCAFTASRLCGAFPVRLLEPFAAPVAVFGNIVLFLSLLIMVR